MQCQAARRILSVSPSPSVPCSNRASCQHFLLAAHTHTHPFNGPLSGTTQVSQYQKGETNLDFTEARDSEWQWHQLGHMEVCTSLQTDTTPAPHRSVFYRPGALPAAQPTVSKHWRHILLADPLLICIKVTIKDLILLLTRLVLPFWYQLIWVVLDKGPLNGCVCVLTKLVDSCLGLPW